jgi:hypothetical protein
MMYLRSLNRLILISLALLGLSISTVSSPAYGALFEYTYSSPTFHLFADGTPPAGQSAPVCIGACNFDGNDSVSGSFTLEGGLQANLSLAAVNPLAWSFTAGILSMDNSLSSVNTKFLFSTDGAGTITDWEVQVDRFVGFGPGEQYHQIDVLSFTNSALIQECTLFTGTPEECVGSSIMEDFGAEETGRGEWSVQEVGAVPVPAAIWLFGTALIGFVGMSRRRKVA